MNIAVYSPSHGAGGDCSRCLPEKERQLTVTHSSVGSVTQQKSWYPEREHFWRTRQFTRASHQQHLTSSLWRSWGLGRGGPLLGEWSPGGCFAVACGTLCVSRRNCVGFNILLTRSIFDSMLLSIIFTAELGHLLSQHQLCLLLQLPDILNGEPIPFILPAPRLPMGTDHDLPQACKVKTSLSPVLSTPAIHLLPSSKPQDVVAGILQWQQNHNALSCSKGPSYSKQDGKSVTSCTSPLQFSARKHTLKN